MEFQVEFLRTLEDGIRLVPDLDRLERVEQFKVKEDGPSECIIYIQSLRKLQLVLRLFPLECAAA